MMFDAALNQPLSLDTIYYPSTAWQKRKATIEGQQHLGHALALRLNAVLQVLQQFGKRR
jgi:hypothetical protein